MAIFVQQHMPAFQGFGKAGFTPRICASSMHPVFAKANQNRDQYNKAVEERYGTTKGKIYRADFRRGLSGAKYQINKRAAEQVALYICMSMAKTTSNGKRGGMLKGPSHDNGGIPAIVTDAGNKPVELEGDEAIINKRSMNSKKVITVTGTPCEIASKINSMDGNGVKIPCPQEGGHDDCPGCKYACGGTVHHAPPAQRHLKYTTIWMIYG